MLGDLAHGVDVAERTRAATRYNTLIDMDLAVDDLALHIAGDVLIILKHALGVLFNDRHCILRVGDNFRKRVDIAGVERKCNGWHNGIEIDLDDAIVERDCARSHFLVALGTAMNLKVTLCLLIRHPNGGKTRGLGGHRVNTVSIVHR